MWVEVLVGGSVPLAESEDREEGVKGLGEWRSETVVQQSWSTNEQKVRA